jgi:hypothetical protein
MKIAAVRSTRYIYVLLSTYAINLHATVIQQMVVILSEQIYSKGYNG